MTKNYSDVKAEMQGTANEGIEYDAQNYHHLLPICFKDYDNSNSEFQAQYYEYTKYNSFNGGIPYVNNFSSIFNMTHPVNFCHDRNMNQSEKRPSSSESISAVGTDDEDSNKKNGYRPNAIAYINNSAPPSVGSATDSTGTSKKTFTCTYCEKKFSTKQNMFIHCRIHTNEKPFGCEDCLKKFTTKQNLVLHIRTHTNEKPYQCETCDSKFTTKQNLTVHGRTHTQERPFVCENCDKKFSTKQNLDTHFRIHSEIKPFSCHICSKQFCTKQNRDTHLKTHLGGVDGVTKRSSNHHNTSSSNNSNNNNNNNNNNSNNNSNNSSNNNNNNNNSSNNNSSNSNNNNANSNANVNASTNINNSGNSNHSPSPSVITGVGVSSSQTPTAVEGWPPDNQCYMRFPSNTANMYLHPYSYHLKSDPRTNNTCNKSTNT